MDNRSSRKVTVVNNDLAYSWSDVPKTKYDNWRQMSSQEMRDDGTVDGFPFFLQIEPTNYCNLKCPICPAGGWGFKRSKRHMTLEEFKSIIDDMEEYLLFVTLWDWGEPLLNPGFPEMIRYASERDIKTVTSTNCNCTFFHDEAYMERLLRSGLTTLIVAVDSIHQENYESYRKQGDLTRALEGIRRVVSMKKKLGTGPLITMRTVIMKHNENELGSLRKLARELGVDRFSLKTFNPLYESETSDRDIVPRNPRYRRYQYKKGSFERVMIPYRCDIISRQSTIHSNGNVVPCCWCYDDDHVAGNVFTDGGFRKIWNSGPYRDLRKTILLDRDSVPYCKTCAFNYKFSKVGWFLETLDLTQSRKNQYRYMIKRYIELHANTKLLEGIIHTRDSIKALFK